MERLIPEGGISPNTIQDEVAQALALYLGNAGLDSGMCGPTAIGLMAIIQDALDADSLAIVKYMVVAKATRYNDWITQHHPTFKPQITQFIPNPFVMSQVTFFIERTLCRESKTLGGLALLHRTVQVELVHPKKDRWVIVVDGSGVLTTSGEVEHNPLASYRTDEFIARSRFTFQEAMQRASDFIAVHTPYSPPGTHCDRCGCELSDTNRTKKPAGWSLCIDCNELLDKD